jgi:hypothetical protein
MFLMLATSGLGFEVVLYMSVTVLYFGYFSHGLELPFLDGLLCLCSTI